MRRLLDEHAVRSDLAVAHLKAPIRHRALDVQANSLHLKRLQEEHALRGCSCRSARQLEIARTREDHAALHDVIGNQGVQRASDR